MLRGRFAALCAALLVLAGATSTLNSGEAEAAVAKPVLYLTFDDGPSEDGGTAAVLDVLARYDVEATFFVVGSRVDKYPSMLRTMVTQGHAIGNHSYSHPDFNGLNDIPATKSELTRTQQAIVRAGVTAPTCFRPPYGQTSAQIEQAGNDLGLSQQLWDLTTDDWMRGPAEQVTAILNTAQAGDVILLHDAPFDGTKTAGAVEAFLQDRRSDFDFRGLPSCGDAELLVPPTTTTTTAPTTTTTTAPTTTTTAPTTTTTTTVPAPAGPTTSGDCRVGPVNQSIDRKNPLQGSIFRLYCAYLARFPDAGGFDYWQSVAKSEISIRPISEYFSASPEFGQLYGPLTNEQFVALIYRNIFNRVADTGGSTYWLELLDRRAVSRGEVVLQFSESEEFRRQTATS